MNRSSTTKILMATFVLAAAFMAATNTFAQSDVASEANVSAMTHYKKGISYMSDSGEAKNYAKAYAHLSMAIESGELTGDVAMMASKSLDKLMEIATEEEIKAGKIILESYRSGKVTTPQ